MNKAITLILIALTLCAATFAQEITPCCQCGKHHEIQVPIINHDEVNKLKGSKKFIGNGNIGSGVNLNDGPQLIFSGTQNISATINIDRHMYAHGIIKADHIIAHDSTTIFVNQNSRLTIGKYIPKKGTRLMGWDESSVFVIDGKEYHVGDTVNIGNISIIIEKCNTSLPVSYETISVKKNGKGFTLEFTTSKEQGSKEFIIQVSRDGKEFKDIEVIKSKSIGVNSDMPINYQFSTTGIVLGFILPFAAIGVGIGFNRRKQALLFFVVAFLFIGCKKNGTVIDTGLKEANYVRIKQVDINGGFNYSKVLKIR